ncbi:hypothetical protein ACHAXR_007165 [Thalassiosira sp. AJA248-18]
MAPYLRLRAAMAASRNQCRRLMNQRHQKQTALLDCHQQQHQRRDMSVYGFGQQWTGALSRGDSNLTLEEAPEISPEEIQQFGECQSMVSLDGVVEGRKCVAASAGWGHTALLVADETSDSDETKTSNIKPKLMVCGRPHDFQQLMRLRRLPSFARNFCIKYTVPNLEDVEDQPPSILQQIATYLAGDNQVTMNEADCRRYSNMPTLLEVDLPSGDVPAIEGEELTKTTFESHAAGRIAQEDGKLRHTPLHTRFQNTLATSAGVTAVISKSGTLYTFGLNHRGQCGTGTFTPNVWTPSRVAGLASTRFIIDHGTGTGENMFKEFKEQENPIVSVALGLQHGVALDSEGQIFCWGKGERGQLGQGRRRAHEGLEGEEGNAQVEEEEPYENRTFDYALHVPNFYDPYTTTTPSPNDMFAPLLSQNDSKIRLISAGMNFTVAVTNSNLPYIWGKNVCLNPSYLESGINIRAKPVEDSTYPRYIPGLPPNLRIERVACGTHHVAMLLEDGSIWAAGVATDKPVPLWGEAVEILAPGLVEIKELVSFTAGFDRTVVVSGVDRRQVIEVQLWSHEELRQHGAVRPSWLDWLSAEEKVCSVHRGWMHSVVVTDQA